MVIRDGSSVRDVTLTIEPGDIFGKSGTFANMVITRGSKIMAESRSPRPLSFHQMMMAMMARESGVA